MQKFSASDIKSFEFSDIKGTHVVSQNEFKSFDFKQLNGDPFNGEKLTEESIRTERDFEKSNKGFKIDGAVRDRRGLSGQEDSDFEKRVQDEVTKRIKAELLRATSEGLEIGRQAGHDEAFKKFETVVAAKTEELSQIVAQVKHQSEKLIDKNRSEIYEFVKKFTKWIILKEIDEKKYLETLFEKLILELNARKNIIVKVGKGNFSQMPEIVQAVETRLGQLSNVRIEAVPEINHPGLIIESENGLIDGSMEGVFENIDKIFQQVVKHE